MAAVPIQAALAAPAIVAPLVGIDFMLAVIGFNDGNERARIMEAGLAAYEDFRFLKEKNITNMADEFGKRTIADGRIVFGLGRVMKLIGIMHWIQDHYRTDDVPDHDTFNLHELAEAQNRAIVRQANKDSEDTNTKTAKPGQFKDESKWPEWEKAFMTYLAIVPGVNGIPLSYVVREDEHPDPNAVYTTFKQRMIARAPLTGQNYDSDTFQVHTLLAGFIQGEQSESWIRHLAKHEDGRRDMIALRRHYAGEGNSTRRISDAKRIQTTLHYKSERALPFNKFLDSLQKMFTIFEEENEPLTERAKVN